MKRLFIFLMVAGLVMSVGGVATADQFWGSASVPWGTGGSVLFKVDTATGVVGTTYSYSDWSMTADVTYAPGNILYAVHNNTADLYNFKMAKIDATTGAVLSDSLVASFSGTDYPQWNAMEYYNGNIYAVENSTAASYHATRYPNWNGTANSNRGHVYKVGLNGSGDPTSATLGAYIGGYPAPDGALAYRDGTWYASDWRTDHSSWIAQTTDVMNTNFTESVSTSPVGLFDGWDFEADGDLLGVSWWAYTGTPSDDFNIYKIDPTNGSATPLFNIKSQLPSNIESLSGLSNTAVPEPATMLLLCLGLVGIAGIRRKFSN